MRKQVRRCVVIVLSVAGIMGSSLTAYAAPAVMPDGVVFDAEFYAANNPDVVTVYGTDTSALYRHYVEYGKAEGRKPAADMTANATADVTAKAAADGTPNVTADVVAATAAVDQKTLDNAKAAHSYYKGLSAEQAAAADAVAKQIADSIMANPAYTTDCQRVTAAAQTVASYCNNSVYGSDVDKYYRSPYGVFVAGVYTCAGSTRALGRVLDYMGYSWQHVNENQWVHQWCILTMDGQTGFADGMGGFAGYGEMISGMTLPDGRVIIFPT